MRNKPRTRPCGFCTTAESSGMLGGGSGAWCSRPACGGLGQCVESSAGCVIVGAGIVGCSVAEHLTRLGWRDVVVLDQGPLFEAGGSTSHAPGLMFQTNPSKMMTDLAKYSVGRYVELELNGRPCGYQVGV